MQSVPWNGLLVVDKASGLTSRAAVDRAQGWFPRGTRIGHTGTLDPLATGVLVLCVGVATRLTEYVHDMAKTYRAGLLLGARSDTDDADGKIERLPVDQAPSQDLVGQVLGGFVGDVEQVPPAYSAAKVIGRRAYALARRGSGVDLRPRLVRIHGIDLLAYAFPHLDIEVRCGKGTYIRSLARDLGERLRCGALVEKLRRTRVGPFGVDQALDLDADSATARARLLPLSAAVSEVPHWTVSATEAARVRQGQTIPFAGVSDLPAEVEEVALIEAERQSLVGVARLDRAGSLLRPAKVFPETTAG